MATHLYTSFPIHTKITSKPLFPSSLSLTTKQLRLPRTSVSASVSVSAAATTSIEVNEPSTSIQPSKSKSLPFRVGHGFDLHRLEPGYPLIIGGIDIPHDRGCEAHSDGKMRFGNYVSHNYPFLYREIFHQFVIVTILLKLFCLALSF